MNTFSHVPPGFRFHPTEEELVDYYLRKKLASRKIDLNVIKDVDLYKMEAWDLEEYCRIGAKDQNEWYFFSHKDKKYPSGTRTNRATIKGFWKATGRDKPIYSKHSLIGMRKTLVYYKGRAPNGQKSDWIMHEYRLESNECGTPQEEGWVVCKAFKKQAPTVRKGSDHEFPYSYNEGICVPDLGSPNEIIIEPPDTVYQLLPHDSSRLPQLESPKLPDYIIHGNFPHSSIISPDEQLKYHCHYQMISMVDQVTDWRILDKFVASQLSQGEISTDLNYSNAPIKQGEAVEFASTSSPSHQIQLQE